MALNILENVSLKELNTFGVENYTRFLVLINSEKNFEELLALPVFKENKKLFLGQGSNVLFTKDFNGLVILNKIKGIEVLKEDKNNVLISAGAGELWHDFVMFCVERNLWGTENLALIPGTVGASPIQNIGAYGAEVKDTLFEVYGFDLKNKQNKILTNKECNFGYRDSIFKQELKDNFFITKVIFKLKKNGEPNLSYKPLKDFFEKKNIIAKNPKEISKAVIEIRQSKLPDPKIIGNAGSFFKNIYISKEKLEELLINYPEMPFFSEKEKIKIPTGWLIEKSGWKGKSLGNVGVYEKQALVLVNLGGAKGEDVLFLAFEISKSVKEMFDIDISPEVNLI